MNKSGMHCVPHPCRVVGIFGRGKIYSEIVLHETKMFEVAITGGEPGQMRTYKHGNRSRPFAIRAFCCFAIIP